MMIDLQLLYNIRDNLKPSKERTIPPSIKRSKENIKLRYQVE